jgi:integrase
MESDGYRQRLKDITVDLMTLVLEMENDEHEKEQLFKIFRPGERIIAFPNLATTKKEETKNEDNEVFLEFTEKEIMKMPKNFRKDFKTGKIKAHIRRREDGRYEVRCQINKKRISATSKTLEIAKQKFIKQLNALTTPQATVTRKNVTLYDYMKKWLETTKKPYIKPNTYKFYLQTFNADIVPRLGTRELTSIKTFELQDFINEYTNAKKFRTAKKIAQLLSAVFDYAVSDELLTRSPMNKVVVAIYEQEHGTPLTRTEESDFIRLFMEDPNIYRQAFVFMLYTGLRRSELASAILADNWVTVTTAKQRKGKKEKTRRIPISPMLRAVLPLIDVAAIKELSVGVLTKQFKKDFPEHHLHELRHTFITRCQECGIQRELVSLWAGHAADSSITSTVYTHLSQFEDRQLAEMQKFKYELL